MLQPSFLFEVLVILFLIVINGALAMSEMALISARKTRLQQLAESGSRGAKTALELLNAPSDFFASIQIGITLIGVLAGTFGGATIAKELGILLRDIPWIGPYSEPIAIGSVVLMVTLLSLIIGELVPKRLALNDSEQLAALVARPIQLISTIAMPAVKLLSLATERILRLIGMKPNQDPPITEEEVKIMIQQGAEAGVFEKEEENMMKRVLKFGDRKVTELMTPRGKLILLNFDAPLDENIKKILDTPHGYFPVYKDNRDHLIGVVSVKCVLASVLKHKTINLEKILIDPLYVSESMPILKLLENFKRTGKDLALVVDEYGVTAGIITARDVLEAIVGDLPDEEEVNNSSIVMRDDGSLLIDGILPAHEFADLLSVPDYEEHTGGDYHTLGGFMMTKLGHIPRTGEHFDWQGYRFEVVDMDGHRVDKVLVTPRIEFKHSEMVKH